MSRKLSVHHIDYGKTNNDFENLISLCLNCHIKTNTQRAYWLGFLQGYIQKHLDNIKGYK